MEAITEEKQTDIAMLLPWLPDTSVATQTFLLAAWYRLHNEDLYPIVFHENPAMNLSDFVGFFSRPNVFMQFCMDVADKTNPKIAGIVWLSEYEILPSHRRATGSFVFFKDYQTPKWTTPFGELALEYWFTKLNLSVLVGMTPKPNRAAQVYSKRLGLRYLGELPGYTSYAGERCDALIAVMTKEEYERVPVAEV